MVDNVKDTISRRAFDDIHKLLGAFTTVIETQINNEALGILD